MKPSSPKRGHVGKMKPLTGKNKKRQLAKKERRAERGPRETRGEAVDPLTLVRGKDSERRRRETDDMIARTRRAVEAAFKRHG